MHFTNFKLAVQTQFAKLQATGQLFRTNIDKDSLYQVYLNSFPEGSNPIFRERTEHDCTCCKQFIRAVGDVVAIMPDGSIESIWDVGTIADEPAYTLVAEAMVALAKSKDIGDIFLHDARVAGTSEAGGFHHFFVNIDKKFVCTDGSIATKLAKARDDHQVLSRALDEIPITSTDTVLELIGQNSLYRGEEHTHSLDMFRAVQVAYASKVSVWKMVTSGTLGGDVMRIRNTSIGTLLIEMNTFPLEDAVNRFEAMKAGPNYKRPTALITQGMIDKANAELTELGLTTALDRRYALIGDISAGNVLFVDNDARPLMASALDTLAPTINIDLGKTKFDKLETVTIDTFVSTILPKITSMEVLFEGQHANRLVTLVAPSDPTAGRLFSWNNNFSWSYVGEAADSIKERVKKAGGNVTGDICCRLSWSNYDDLDLHMVEPRGSHIYYGQFRQGHTPTMAFSPNGGQLDVDMNAGGGDRHNGSREPVENIFYPSFQKMGQGVYTLSVKQYRKVESIDTGFTVEVDILGEITSINYAKTMPTNTVVPVAEIKIELGKTPTVKSLIAGSTSSRPSKEVWGLKTETYVKVKAAMMSPNFWNDNPTPTGNRHFFFMLEGAVAEGAVRGFYNEQLRGDLQSHRKVFEVLGARTAIRDAGPSQQLSGLGFSSTGKGTLVVRVKGSFTRTLQIAF